MSRAVSLQELANLSPVSSLKRENLDALVRKIPVRDAQPGETLFKVGDTNKQAIYVLTGTVQLHRDREPRVRIEGGTTAARNPLSPLLPRHATAVAATPTEYIAIDSDLLDVMLTWDQTGSYEIPKFQPEDPVQDDWVSALLNSRAFHKVPPANIQAVFKRTDEIHCDAGEKIIKQGSEGDYFYIITQGTCAVVRETPSHGEIRLAELHAGETFGEEALLADTPRNATVYTTTPGTLMRLGKEDFRTLLTEPMLDWVDAAEGEAIVKAGGQWLDVRLRNEFSAYHYPRAINIPLYFLRLKLSTLEKAAHYVLCCDTGQRSAAAAFILNKLGYHTCVLKGGLNAAEGARLRGPTS